MAEQKSTPVGITRTTAFLGYVSDNPKDGKNRAGVYYIVNNQTGRIYIGSALNIYARWACHKSVLNKGTHHSKHLQRSWNKYGSKAFEFRIITFVDNPEKLRETEQFFLNKCRPVYNSTLVASITMSADIREKLSASMRGERNPFYGKKHSEETRRKMKENRPDLSGENNPMYGVRLTGEKNPMWGRKKPETAEFNRRTKKGKTWEEMYGVARATEMRQRAAEKMKGNTHSRKKTNA